MSNYLMNKPNFAGKPRVQLCLPMSAFQTTVGVNDGVIVNEEIPIQDSLPNPEPIVDFILKYAK